MFYFLLVWIKNKWVQFGPWFHFQVFIIRVNLYFLVRLIYASKSEQAKFQMCLIQKPSRKCSRVLQSGSILEKAEPVMVVLHTTTWERRTPQDPTALLVLTFCWFCCTVWVTFLWRSGFKSRNSLKSELDLLNSCRWKTPFLPDVQSSIFSCVSFTGVL